jgi:hypothetical protein
MMFLQGQAGKQFAQKVVVGGSVWKQGWTKPVRWGKVCPGSGAGVKSRVLGSSVPAVLTGCWHQVCGMKSSIQTTNPKVQARGFPRLASPYLASPDLA